MNHGLHKPLAGRQEIHCLQLHSEDVWICFLCSWLVIGVFEGNRWTFVFLLSFSCSSSDLTSLTVPFRCVEEWRNMVLKYENSYKGSTHNDKYLVLAAFFMFAACCKCILILGIFADYSNFSSVSFKEMLHGYALIKGRIILTWDFSLIFLCFFIFAISSKNH